MADRETEAAVERFKEAQLSGTESVADLPAIASCLNLTPPETPADSPMSSLDVVMSEEYRDLSKPKLTVGDVAFDFTLPKLDMSQGKERDTGETVTLSNYFGVQPVALIFGSYT